MSNHLKLCVSEILSDTDSFEIVTLRSLEMNWWLLHEGTTRSHLELGRETLSRQWYFSLSCGRVGHCQFFPKDLPITNFLLLSSLLVIPTVYTCRGFFYALYRLICLMVLRGALMLAQG